jgi:hypothetical protein
MNQMDKKHTCRKIDKRTETFTEHARTDRNTNTVCGTGGDRRFSVVCFLCVQCVVGLFATIGGPPPPEGHVVQLSAWERHTAELIVHSDTFAFHLKFSATLDVNVNFGNRLS